MQFHLVLPGLAWPSGAASQIADAPPLTALSTLLGHARHDWQPTLAPETWLARQFGANAARLPYAALRRGGETPPPEPGAHWLCCDPAHLHFSRDRLLLADASSLAISRAEADTLITGLNEVFADIGRFEAPAPDRWYVALTEEPRPFFHPLADVNGRPIQLFMPEGEDIARWARLANELEVWLYNHPINAAREAAGQRSINGVWLWGAGPQDLPLRAPASQIQADAPFARGLALHAGITPRPATRYIEGTGFAVIDTLQRPSLHFDATAWLSAIAQLETDWFAPLLKALKAKKITALRISAPGDKHHLQLDVAASSLWKFWRKPRPLAALLATAPQPNPQNP